MFKSLLKCNAIVKSMPNLRVGDFVFAAIVAVILLFLVMLIIHDREFSDPDKDSGRVMCLGVAAGCGLFIGLDILKCI